MHGIPAHRIDGAGNGKRIQTRSHREGAGGGVVRSPRGVDRRVDVKVLNADLLGARIVGVRLAQLERRVVHPQSEANGHRVYRLRDGGLRETLRPRRRDEVVAAVAEPLDRHFGLGNVEIDEPEPVRASREKVAKRISHVDAAGIEQRHAGARNVNVHQRRMPKPDALIADG